MTMLRGFRRSRAEDSGFTSVYRECLDVLVNDECFEQSGGFHSLYLANDPMLLHIFSLILVPHHT